MGPLFGDKWYKKSKEARYDANEQFKAAVASAILISDEGVRQVPFPFFMWSIPFLRYLKVFRP